jgi:hypothetical protein
VMIMALLWHQALSRYVPYLTRRTNFA